MGHRLEKRLSSYHYCCCCVVFLVSTSSSSCVAAVVVDAVVQTVMATSVHLWWLVACNRTATALVAARCCHHSVGPVLVFVELCEMKRRPVFLPIVMVVLLQLLCY
jgi:hypothetical protein